VRLVLGTEKYLGLPSMIGRDKNSIFAFIKDRIWKKINAWTGRALSKASKEVMVKSVLQSIPTYIMSIYVLPNSIIDDIEKMINAFWWGGGGNSRGIKWMSWERVACPKEFGGMGFRNFKAFNLAMVAKQGWSFLFNPDSLVARIYKAKYFPRTSLLNAKIGYNPSFAWRSIWNSRQVLLHGCRWAVGSGTQIRVMQDPWIRGDYGSWVPSPQGENVYQMSVNDLLNVGAHTWDSAKIASLFAADTAAAILATPLFDSVISDMILWTAEQDGRYSVKSRYRLIMTEILRTQRFHVEGEWNRLWKVNAPHKARNLLWRICRRCIPTHVNLQSRHVNCEGFCPWCVTSAEDDWHAFLGEMHTYGAGLSTVLLQRTEAAHTLAGFVFDVCQHKVRNVAGRVALLPWHIWAARNDVIWNDTRQSSMTIGRSALAAWQDWNTAQQQRLSRRVQAANSSDQQCNTAWEKPDNQWLKCNVDAAVHRSMSVISFGCCARNSAGQFVKAQTGWQH
jgi:hypothetical protein